MLDFPHLLTGAVKAAEFGLYPNTPTHRAYPQENEFKCTSESLKTRLRLSFKLFKDTLLFLFDLVGYCFLGGPERGNLVQPTVFSLLSFIVCRLYLVSLSHHSHISHFFMVVFHLCILIQTCPHAVKLISHVLLGLPLKCDGSQTFLL